jgi:hypothetical protein
LLVVPCCYASFVVVFSFSLSSILFIFSNGLRFRPPNSCFVCAGMRYCGVHLIFIHWLENATNASYCLLMPTVGGWENHWAHHRGVVCTVRSSPRCQYQEAQHSGGKFSSICDSSVIVYLYDETFVG